MPGGSWLSDFRPRAGAEIPAGLRLTLGAVSGAALSLSYIGAHPSIYSWVCVGILLVSLFGARPRVAFACGFLHALLFVLTSVPWIATVLTVHGDLSVAAGWGVLLLIAMAWGILMGSFAWAVHRLSRQSMALACTGTPFIWVTFEFVRAHLPEISFPWNLLGYPAADNLGLVQITTITGIYGLSFLVAAFNALLAWANAANSWTPRRRITLPAAAAIVLLMASFAAPRLVPQTEAHHFARAVQLNFPEVESYPANWFQAHSADLEEITRISLAASVEKPDLLVWPEAPAPFSFQDSQFAKLASALAIRFGHPFLLGSIEWKPPVDRFDVAPPGTLLPYNSALLFDSQGQRIFVYDKVHLVPFGEYEPFPLIHRVVTSMSGDVGGFHKGNKYLVGQLPGGKTFGVFICYEAIYPGEVRRFASGGAQLLINISNDGWFGRSAAAEQHLRMVHVRAVENRRWIVRSTNNGFTVSIDPYGRVYQPLPPDVRAAAALPYDFRTDQTVYTRFGDWFAWLCVLVSVILVATTFSKGKVTPVPERAVSQKKA
ncbi:MAG TPA: apolipoprotein N-acyltransferase [Candidatus Cybelea sp.]|nr:apolipoprotein N-acyltransferase [Candidatus Cybelea sp.]